MKLTINKIVTILLVSGVLGLLVGVSGATWTIEGDSVCTNNASWGELCTIPHTLHGPGYAYCNATMAEDYGNIDFVWGFNTSLERPRSIDYYNPHWANFTSSQFFQNVSNIVVSEDACETGHEYNNIKRNITYDHCSEWNETTMECETYEQITQVVCFDSYEQEGSNYTVTWHNARMKYWQDISDRIESVNYNWQGMNKWYYIDNVSMPANVTKTVRIWVDMPIVFGVGADTKFFFAAKRTTDTIQEAITADRFMFLDPWHNTSRSHRKTVNVTHVNASSSNLVNYTVFLNVSKESEMQADFDDILFYETDGTAMSFEYENHTTDYGLFWVLVPSLTAASDTQFWMYYGNDAATSSSNPESSWNVNCSMVQHLQEAPANDTPGHLDSTSNDNDGTPKNFNGISTSTTDGTGIINGADVFDGTDDYVDLGNNLKTFGTTGDITISAWIKTTSTWDAIFTYGYFNAYWGRYGLYTHKLCVYDGSLVEATSNDALDGQWHLMTGILSRTDGKVRLYIDGILKDTQDWDGNMSAEGDNKVFIGVRQSTTKDLFLDGLIDEVRIYNRALLADEINQSYQLVENQSTFVTWGSAEQQEGTPPVISNVINGSISSTSQYVDWDVNQTAHNRVLYSNESDLTPTYYSSWDNSTGAPNITLSSLTASTQYWYQAWSYNTTNTSLNDNSSTLSFTTAAEDAVWCNNDYAKRINVSVDNTGGGALTDYQIYVNLSTNPINATSLRVYNASDCTLRPHWCENVTSGNCTKLWINYSAITASAWTNNTAIYYDNAAASTASNGTNTFELFDDFTDNSTISTATDQTTKDTVYDSSIYAMCPYMIKLHDDTLFAVFFEGTQHGAGGNHNMYWINSTDNGSTWSSPSLITDYSDPTAAGNPTALEFNNSGTWTILVGYNRLPGDGTVWAKRKKTTDGGQSWSAETNISDNSYRGIWGTAIEMSNGSLMLPIYKDSGASQGAFGAISSDNGDNWTEYTIGTTATSETSVIEKSTNGHILAISRDYPNGKFYKSVSTDYGLTWSAQTDTGITTVDAPAALLRLIDGDLLLSWERTNTDFRTMRSNNEGDSWNEGNSYSVYYDGSMPANAGYPSTVQINNTHVYSMFYVQYAAGHADIHGNYVDISKSRVWYKTGTPTLTYANSILRINYIDNTDHRLTSTESFSAPHIMESRSKINWSGINYAQLGFGLFAATAPGIEYANYQMESSGNSNSYPRNANGTATVGTTGVNMDNYFVNKIKWKSDEVKFVYTGGTITHTTYIPSASIPIVIGGAGYSSGAFDMYLDWLFVRKYASSEPSTSLGSEENQPATTPTLHIGNAINTKADWGRDFNSNLSANVTTANASGVWMNFTNAEFTNTSLGWLNLTLDEWVNESHNVNAPVTNISVTVYLTSPTSGATNDTDSFWYEITKRTNTVTMDSAATQSVDTSETFYVNATCNEEYSDTFYGAANLLEDGSIIDTDTSVTDYVNFSHSESSAGQYNYTVRFYNLTHYNNATTPTYSNVTVFDVEYVPPDPINLANTTGNFWVNHTWSADSGNVTDSFNVSIHPIWFNTTLTMYYNDTGLTPHVWSNITAWAFNNSGNGSLSTGSVSDNVQIPNNAVTLTVTQNYNKLETETVFISDTASSDTDGDTPAYSCNRTDLFVDFSTVTGYGNWTTLTTDAGTYYIDIGVSDGWGSTDNKTLTIIITDATPGTPFGLANTSGNFWVNHTWTNGVNTDTFNVSVNLSWNNGSSNEYYNNTPLSAHKWSNVSVYGFNSTSGELSSGISQNTQIPNNPITITNTSDWSGFETQNVYIDYDATDADSDTPTFSCNRTDLFVDFDGVTGKGNWTSIEGTIYVDFGVADGYGSTSNYTMTIVASDAEAGIPTNLVNVSGNFWINHTWNTGINTDTFNVSINSSWNNGTVNTYYNNTALSAHTWSNITVAGFNDTIRSLSAFISQDTPIPNNVPILSGLPDNTTDEDVNQTDIFDLDDYFTDADSDTPTYLVESNNQSAYVSVTINVSNNVSYTLASGWNGTASVVINATDGWEGEDNDTFLIIVNAAPLPGDYTPDDPTTLQNITGNYWVNYTWNVGGGNVTDSYNVSWNLSWYNTTTDTFMQKEVGASNWANITVYAYNSSGNGSLSTGSVSDNVQAPAFVPGDYIPPNPTTLQNTTGNYYVNYTWVMGVPGNITDSYNVSWNLSWFNGTLTTYMQKEVGASNWGNITVYAFNSSGNGTLSSGSLSDNVQAPAFVPGDYIPATPTTLANTTGNYWVNYTWSDGSGANITDSYNVSWNLSWFNNTLTTYMQKDVGASGWGNITIYAFNSSGNGSLSTGYISDEVQAPSAPIGDYIPPTPINLVNSTGNGWVNYTWNSGAGNITDSYNVSWNLTWYNNTLVPYMNDTVGEFGWANITVYAFNSSGNGTLSAGSISDDTQADGGTYTTSMGTTAYNLITYYGSSTSTAEQFGLDIGDVGYVCIYNGSFYSHTMGFSANNFTTYHGIGYYVYLNASGSSTYQRNNIPEVPYNTQLFNRWNTIGWTNSTNTNAEGIATSIGSACKYTSMLNADGITYTTHTVGFTSNNHAVDKGKGYWVWTNTGLSWSRNS